MSNRKSCSNYTQMSALRDATSMARRLLPLKGAIVDLVAFSEGLTS
jgi:hypothetical protein